MASAQAHGVPVVSAKQMLTWLDGRNGSSFGDLAWSGNTLSFSIAVALGRAQPARDAAHGRGARAAQRRSRATALRSRSRPRRSRASTTRSSRPTPAPTWRPMPADTHAARRSPRVVADAARRRHRDGHWTTDEASDSRVDYGTVGGRAVAVVQRLGAGHLAQRRADRAVSQGTTYHFRVTSADAAANTATEPAPPAAPATFTTPARRASWIAPTPTSARARSTRTPASHSLATAS